MDYEDIDGPPLHPNCRCSMQPKLDDEYEDILKEAEAQLAKEAELNEAALIAENREEFEANEAEVRRIMR